MTVDQHHPEDLAQGSATGGPGTELPSQGGRRPPGGPAADAPARRRLLGVPALIWLLVSLNLGVTLGYTAFFPHDRYPDERMHVDLVVQVALGRAWPWPAPAS